MTLCLKSRNGSSEISSFNDPMFEIHVVAARFETSAVLHNPKSKAPASCLIGSLAFVSCTCSFPCYFLSLVYAICRV